MLKPEIKDRYFIIHNIPKLNELYFDGGEFIKSYHEDKNEIEINPPELFELEVQKKLAQDVKEKYNRPVLFIIDECQTWLDKYNEKIKGWLSYHRHLGQDIWLVTQSRFNIHKDYKNLIEIEILGKRGFVFKSFLYSWFANGEHFKTDRIPKKKDIFKLYQSFQLDSNQGKRSKLFYWMAGFIIAALVIGGFYAVKLRNNLRNIASKNKEKVADVKKIDLLKDAAKDPVKYYYVGYVGSVAVLQDEKGDLFPIDDVIDGDYYQIDKKKSAVIYINSNTGSGKFKRKLGAVIESAQSEGGKPASASARVQSQVWGQEARRKVIQIE